MAFTLTDFFKQYQFHGQLERPDGHDDFTLTVYEYDHHTGLFLAGGKDNQGLSAIIGKIRALNPLESRVGFMRHFEASDYAHGRRNDEFRGALQKTDSGLMLRGIYHAGTDPEPRVFDLGPRLRKGGLIYMGWLDNAVAVELPEQEQG